MRLLDILAKRATDLGADVRFEREVEGLSEFADADLIVACDGVNSRVSQLYADHFQTNGGMVTCPSSNGSLPATIKSA